MISKSRMQSRLIVKRRAFDAAQPVLKLELSDSMVLWYSLLESFIYTFNLIIITERDVGPNYNRKNASNIDYRNITICIV